MADEVVSHIQIRTLELAEPKLHDEEVEDFENMLSSMRDVLSSSCHSPTATIPTVKNVINEVNNEEDEDDDDDRCTSSLSKLNEDWDSDEGDADNDNGGDRTADTEKETMRAERKAKAKETLFQRIEESRKALEDELGLDRFLEVYKYLQAMQENEDDELNVGTGPATEITDLLGSDHEHLYPKVLYLVMADAAYFEDND